MNTARWMLMAALSFGLAACDDTAQGVREDTREAGEAVEGAAPEAREYGNEAMEEGRELGRTAEGMAGEAGTAFDAAQQTAEIKAALMADATIDGTDVDVDTSGDTKTVTLSGTVETEGAKNKAEAIAQAKSPGYTVVNNLQVEAGGARAQ